MKFFVATEMPSEQQFKQQSCYMDQGEVYSEKRYVFCLFTTLNSRQDKEENRLTHLGGDSGRLTYLLSALDVGVCYWYGIHSDVPISCE
jgi:hypothetical protein